MPSRLDRDVQSPEIKAPPLSDVMCSGNPKREIHKLSKAAAHDDADSSVIGVASGHLVERSMIVNRYRNPSEAGKGPTMSTWMCANLRCG